MTKLYVRSFAVSIDGYGAGPRQDLANPLGVNGPELMEWFFSTRMWRTMHAQADGETGVDNGMAEKGFAGIGAWILGRNMFGPVRGPWPDESWRGWWGEEPPYHTPVFVLTHHARAPLQMKGGTEFHFVTDGIHAALERAVRGRRRSGCAPRRRCGNDSAVPAGSFDRRAASRAATDPARSRGTSLPRHRPACPRLSMRGARDRRARYPPLRAALPLR